MPRFVVLRHQKESGAHFDLMLENAGTLVTFSFPVFPTPGTVGEKIFDHRLDYLDIEGDLGKGKGVVARVESGTFDLLVLSSEAVYAFLRGERLRGNIRLTREGGNTWRLDAG